MFDLVWRPGLVCAGMAFVAGLVMTPALAESIEKQCSVKYQAAKAANSLNGQTWNEFYKQCAAELKGAPASGAAAPAAAPATTEAAPPAPEKHRKKKEEATAPAAPAAAPAATEAAPAPSGPIVFPTAVSPSYASQTPAKQRFHTCLDQYHTNKTTNSNGGLRWIEKGDGYYSECNKKLKGGA
jgi:hypothetical protein